MSPRRPAGSSPIRPAAPHAISASRTTPTEWVFVRAIGVVNVPESRIHSRPVSSPLPLIVCEAAKSGSGGGMTTVTPVRTLSPSISVVWPTATPGTSVIALAGPVGSVPSSIPRSRARCIGRR